VNLTPPGRVRADVDEELAAVAAVEHFVERLREGVETLLHLLVHGHGACVAPWRNRAAREVDVPLEYIQQRLASAAGSEEKWCITLNPAMELDFSASFK
jgi:hypothetical protein